jgi:NAD dependent epimerase/dehydratase family enzyme
MGTQLFASNTPRTRKIALRSAMVMSVERGGSLKSFSVWFGLDWAEPGGSGLQFMSWIHEEDFLRAVEFLIRREDIAGAVNLAAPGPLPTSSFCATAQCVGTVSVCQPLLDVGDRCVLSPARDEALLKSRRVVPAVLQNHGCEFLFPHWPEAANDLVRRWRTKAAIRVSREFIQDCQEATVERAN